MDSITREQLERYRKETAERDQLQVNQHRAAFEAAIAALPSTVTNISAGYSGSSDEGNFDSIEFFDTDNQKVAIGDDDCGIEKYLDAILEREHPGWENEDGGAGEFNIDLRLRRITHEHREFYTESTSTDHDYGFDGMPSKKSEG